MKSLVHMVRVAGFAVASAMILGLFAPVPSHAESTDGTPSQSSCDTNIGPYAWNTLGIARPQIASMTVDGETIADPTNPTVGSIGAVFCASQANGRMVGLSIYREDSDGGHQDLTGALTPSGQPITASSKITLEMTNLGDNAKYYTFSLVHGVVSSWTTAHLGTASASLTLTLSPARNTLGTGDDFGLCTATPPQCHATKSDLDILGAGLAMTFDPNYGSAVSGTYYGLVSAMGGAVEVKQDTDNSKYLVATLGGPHFLADGVTPNVGSLRAFLPTSVLNTLFGITSGDIDTSTLAVTRTDSSSTAAVPFTVTPVAGGVIVGLTDITFSSPVFTIKKAVATTSSSTSSSSTTTTTKTNTTKKATTTSKIAVDKTKSYIRVDGSGIVADGQQTFKIVIGLEDANGKPITDRKPGIVMTGGQTTLHDIVLIGNEWIAEVSSNVPGEIKAAISAGGVDLGTLTMTFVAPPQAAVTKPVSTKTPVTTPVSEEPKSESSPIIWGLGGVGILMLLGLAFKFKGSLLASLHRKIM